MLCVAGPLPFCFRTVPDLCQASLLSRSLPLWPASPHLRAHTQKNTQWFITAAWKGWIIHLGIPKTWVCCSFITCSALDYRQLPFPSSLSLMGQQVFNTLFYPLFTYPPQIWLHSVYVCMCFNDMLAKLFTNWITFFCQISPPPISKQSLSRCSDAIITMKDHVIRDSGRDWISGRDSVTRLCLWEAAYAGARAGAP